MLLGAPRKLFISVFLTLKNLRKFMAKKNTVMNLTDYAVYDSSIRFSPVYVLEPSC